MRATALDDQRQPEGEQQPVKVIELVEPLQKQSLDDDAGDADQNRRDDQRRPIAKARILQEQIGRKGAHHVLGAVAEVDDVEHAEDNGQPQAEQRIERAVDQADQQLPEQRLRRDAEDFEHGSREIERRANRPPLMSHQDQPVTSGQLPSLSGRKASSAGMVARTL